GAATLDSYGFGSRPDSLPAQHLELLRNCLPYHERGEYIFLHANYDSNLPLDEQPDTALRWESLRERMPLRHVSGKTVIVGHTPQQEGQILDRGYLKCIDTHCYAGGWLTALEVTTGRLWQANQSGELRTQ